MCGSDQHLTGGMSGSNSIPSNSININAHQLIHNRGNSIDQSQPSQPQHHQLHPHQPQAAHIQTSLQQQQQQQQPQQQQQLQPQQQQQQLQQSNQHQLHQQPSHTLGQHHMQQNQVMNNSSGSVLIGSGIPQQNGVASESQLKNLLFNLLSKEGQGAIPLINATQDNSKQRNETLAVIANSLIKIEDHLGKIASAVTNSLFVQTINHGVSDNDNRGMSNSSTNNLDINNNDGNNSVSITGAGNSGSMTDQGGAD